MANIYDDLFQGAASSAPEQNTVPANPYESLFTGGPAPSASPVPEQSGEWDPTTGSQKIGKVVDTTKMLWENRDKVVETVQTGADNLVAEGMRSLTGLSSDIGTDNEAAAKSFKNQYANANDQVEREAVLTQARNSGIVKDEAKFANYLKSGGTKTNVTDDQVERQAQQRIAEENKMASSGVPTTSQARKSFFDIVSKPASGMTDIRGMSETMDLSDAFASSYQKKWSELSSGPEGLNESDADFLKKYKAMQESYLADVMKEAVRLRNQTGSSDFDFEQASEPVLNARRKELMRIELEYKARQDQVNGKKTDKLGKLGMDALTSGDLISAVSNFTGAGVNKLTEALTGVSAVVSTLAEGLGGETLGLDTLSADFAQSQRVDQLDATSGIGKRTYRMISNGWNSLLDNSPDIAVALADVAFGMKGAGRLQKGVEETLAGVKAVKKTLELVDDAVPLMSKDWAIGKGVRVLGEAAQNAVINPSFSSAFNVLAGGHTFNSEEAFQDMMGNAVGDSMFYLALQPQFRTRAAADIFDRIGIANANPDKFLSKEAIEAIQRGDIPSTVALITRQANSGKEVAAYVPSAEEMPAAQAIKDLMAGYVKDGKVDGTVASLAKQVSDQMDKALASGSKTVEQEAGKNAGKAASDASARYASVVEGRAMPSTSEKTLSLGDAMAALFERRDGKLLPRKLSDVVERSKAFKGVPEDVVAELQRAAATSGTDYKSVAKAFNAYAEALFNASSEGKIPEGFSFGRYFHSEGKWIDVLTGEDVTQAFKNGDFSSGKMSMVRGMTDKGIPKPQAVAAAEEFQSAMISGKYSISKDTYEYFSLAFPKLAKFFEKNKGTGKYEIKKNIQKYSPLASLVSQEMTTSEKVAAGQYGNISREELNKHGKKVKAQMRAQAKKEYFSAEKIAEREARKQQRLIDLGDVDQVAKTLESLDEVSTVSEEILNSGLTKVVNRVAKKFESHTGPLMDGFKEIAIALREDFSQVKAGEEYGFASIAVKLEKFLSPAYIKAVREAAQGDADICRELLISHIAKAFPDNKLTGALQNLSLNRLKDVSVQSEIVTRVIGNAFFGAEKRNPRSFIRSTAVLALWDKHLSKYADELQFLLTDISGTGMKLRTKGDITATAVNAPTIRIALGTLEVGGKKEAEATFVHEFAHHLNGYLEKEEWGNVQKAFFEAKMLRAKELTAAGVFPTVKEAFDGLGHGKGQLESDYRFKNGFEWFAENMKEAILGTSTIKAFVEMLPAGVRKIVRFAIDFFRDLLGFRNSVKKEYEGYLAKIIDESDALSKIKHADKPTNIFHASLRSSHALEELTSSLAKGKDKDAKPDLLKRIAIEVARATKGMYTGMDELRFEGIMRKAYKDAYADAQKSKSKLDGESLIAFHRSLSTGENIRSMLKAARNGDAEDMMRQFAATLSTGRLPATDAAKEFDDLATLPSKNAKYIVSPEKGSKSGKATYAFSFRKELPTTTLADALAKRGDTLIISSDAFNALSEADYEKLMANWMDVRFTRGPLFLRDNGTAEVNAKDVQVFSDVFKKQGIDHEFEPEKYVSSAAVAAKDASVRGDIMRNREMTSEFLALQYGKEARKNDALFSTAEILDKSIPLPVFFTKLADLIRKTGYGIRQVQVSDVLNAMSSLSTPGNIARAALKKTGVPEMANGNFFVDISKYLKFEKSEDTGKIYEKLSGLLSESPTVSQIDDAVLRLAFADGVSLSYAKRDVGSFMADLLAGRSAIPKEKLDSLLSSTWFRMLFGTPEEWMAKEYVKKVALASSNGDGAALRDFIESYNENIAEIAVKNGYKESQDIAIIKTIEILKAYGYVPANINAAKASLAFAAAEPDAYLGVGKHFTTWDRSQLKPSEAKEQGFGHALEKMVKSITADVQTGKLADLTDAEKEAMSALGESSGRDLQDQLAAAVWTHIEEIKQASDKYMSDRHLVDVPSVTDAGVAGVPVASMWHPANYKIAAGPMKIFLDGLWSKSSGKNSEELKQTLLGKLGIPHKSVMTNPKYSDKENKYFSPFSDLYNFVTGHSELMDFAEDFLFAGKGMNELGEAIKKKTVSVLVDDREVFGGTVENMSALASALRPGVKTTFLSDSGARMVFTDKNWHRNPLFTALVNDLESKTGIKLFANTPEGTADNALRALKEDVTETFGDIKLSSVRDIISLGKSKRSSEIAKKALGVKDVVGGVAAKLDDSGVEAYSPIMKLGGDKEGVKAYRASVAYVNLRNNLAKLISSTEKVFEDDGFVHTPAILNDLSKIFSDSMGIAEAELKDVKIESSLLPVYEVFQDSDLDPITLGQIIGFTNGDTAERIGTKVLDIKQAYNAAGFSILDDGNEALKLTAEFKHDGKEYRISVNGREHIVEELEKPAIISAKDPSEANFKSEDVITSPC